MISTDRVVVYDVDGTLCKSKEPHQSYLEVEPITEVCEHVRQLHASGIYIILYTSRQMRTYEGNEGKILANTAPILFEWLKKHDIPYDEIHFGKPWCSGGFYVDDKALRPAEVIGKTYEECVEYLEVRNIPLTGFPEEVSLSFNKLPSDRVYASAVVAIKYFNKLYLLKSRYTRTGIISQEEFYILCNFCEQKREKYLFLDMGKGL